MNRRSSNFGKVKESPSLQGMPHGTPNFCCNMIRGVGFAERPQSRSRGVLLKGHTHLPHSCASSGRRAAVHPSRWSDRVPVRARLVKTSHGRNCQVVRLAAGLCHSLPSGVKGAPLRFASLRDGPLGRP